MLHVHLEVVLELFTDGGHVLHRRDADAAQVLGVADARQLQQLGRVERSAAQHHLAGRDMAAARPPHVR